MTINYDGRRFRALNGGDGVCAQYNQRGDLVWSEFEGGHVRRGTVIGTCDADGVLRFAYTMVLQTGEVIAGHSTNWPQRVGGTLVLREVWERYGEHAATGVSYLEEIPR
ncbi:MULTISPECIES: hypothetical protein [Dactylosporangium]|uniref:Uncharacterized protein n=2 Tax=Dactylosporangium TaxID=35753 RepID=A0A9W6KL89_9ACTN|nr:MULTISPECIES: hypothetical protein [Dactylosporangium]UAC01118.1 hypothetical protein Dvina_25535 [Dactylosporangium vinaceum]UWZ48683.1 hypothetical protein Dmats_21120 [Dactylosporangium matsuzakiense]GLL03052.1 hypothetical protein GCM10017581_047950 [Dactylosporangium matsuzakiense]